jgi:hypothetical protein
MPGFASLITQTAYVLAIFAVFAFPAYFLATFTMTTLGDDGCSSAASSCWHSPLRIVARSWSNHHRRPLLTS